MKTPFLLMQDLVNQLPFFIYKLREKLPLQWVALFIIIHKNTLRSNKFILIAHSQTVFWNMFLLIGLDCNMTSNIRWCIWQDSWQALVMGIFSLNMLVSIDLWNVQRQKKNDNGSISSEINPLVVFLGSLLFVNTFYEIFAYTYTLYSSYILNVTRRFWAHCIYTKLIRICFNIFFYCYFVIY